MWALLINISNNHIHIWHILGFDFHLCISGQTHLTAHLITVACKSGWMLTKDMGYISKTLRRPTAAYHTSWYMQSDVYGEEGDTVEKLSETIPATALPIIQVAFNAPLTLTIPDMMSKG